MKPFVQLLIESNEKKLPHIFTHTKYALPSDEDLTEIDRCNLTPEEIVKGFGYFYFRYESL